MTVMNATASDTSHVERRDDGRGGQTRRDRPDRGGELAEAGPAHLEREPEPACGASGRRDQRRVLGLREVDEPAVIAEIRRKELRVPIQAEALDHQALEITGQEVGEEERGRLLVR